MAGTVEVMKRDEKEQRRTPDTVTDGTQRPVRSSGYKIVPRRTTKSMHGTLFPGGLMGLLLLLAEQPGHRTYGIRSTGAGLP